MKTNNQIYDTKQAKEICSEPSPDGDDYLYQMPDGRFFLQVGTTFLDGVKIRPDQDVNELAPELDRVEFRNEPEESYFARRRARVRYVRTIVPISGREALVWCVKTQIPECFRGYVLESI
jgi:hypothetical protein